MKKLYKIIKLLILGLATTFLGITTISKIKSNVWSGWKSTENVQLIRVFSNGAILYGCNPSETTIVRYKNKGNNSIKIETTLLTYGGLNKEIVTYIFNDITYAITYKTTYIYQS